MGKKQKTRKENDPAYSPHRASHQKRKKKNKFGKHNTFFWGKQEQTLYIEYLQTFEFQFNNMKDRKRNKVFVLMSSFIKLRGPDQCRSHHQKMCKKYGTIKEIVEGIRQDKLKCMDLDYPEIVSIENLKENEKQQIQIDEENSSILENEELLEDKMQSNQQSFENQSQLWGFLDKNAWICK